MKQNGLSLVLILGLIGLIVVLWDTDPALLLPKEKERQADVQFPYAMLKDTKTQHFNDAGNLSYEFFARELHHYRQNLSRTQSDDYTTMSTPELTFYTQGAPWKVTAKSGKIEELGSKLTLNGDVTVWQTQANGETTKLTTSLLVIYPETKVVKTEAPVIIDSPVGQLSAVGMKVNLDTRNIQLLSKVRGHYEPI